jgi:predicted Zn-dependent peptidase
MTVRIEKLPSGLRIVTDSFDSPLAVLQVSVEVGTRWEPPHLNGLAHFLEHMAFKGTLRRTASDISEAIENRGGWINAGTGKDITNYYTGVLAEDAPVALDVLADIVCNSTLPEEEFERERGVILQEIADLEDEPMSWLADRMMEITFIGGLGMPGLGSPETLRRIEVSDLANLVAAHYEPGTIIVSAAGGVDHDAITRAAEQLFDLGHREVSKRHESRKSEFFGGNSFRQARKTDQVQIIVAFPSFSLGDPDLYADCVLQKIIGGCSTSRLWRALREDRGLCYDVYSSAQAWREAGIVGVKLSTGADSAAEAISALVTELQKVRDAGLTDEELARGKKLMRAEIVMENESAASRVGAVAHHLAIHDRAYDLNEELDRFAAVDHRAIGRCIERMWSTPAAVAIRGPKRIVETDIQEMLRA